MPINLFRVAERTYLQFMMELLPLFKERLWLFILKKSFQQKRNGVHRIDKFQKLGWLKRVLNWANSSQFWWMFKIHVSIQIARPLELLNQQATRQHCSRSVEQRNANFDSKLKIDNRFFSREGSYSIFDNTARFSFYPWASHPNVQTPFHKIKNVLHFSLSNIV